MSSDHELVERVRAGDLAAYGDLVRRHGASARRMAVLWGAGPDADDVVQEAFVKAYRGLGGYDGAHGFRPWLLRIVTREAANLRRAAGRREQREERWQRMLLAGHDAEEATDGALLTRRAELAAAIARLPEPQRAVIICRYLMELSEAETAVALGVAAGTVKSRLHRGLARLREVMPDD